MNWWNATTCWQGHRKEPFRGPNDALRSAPWSACLMVRAQRTRRQGKPDPLMLRELMEEFMSSLSCCALGWRHHADLQMAARTPVCASVGVSYGAHEPDAFAAISQPRFVAIRCFALRIGCCAATPGWSMNVSDPDAAVAGSMQFCRSPGGRGDAVPSLMWCAGGH